MNALGELLMERGLIAPRDLDVALARHQETGAPLQRCLVETGVVTERDVVATIATQVGIAFADCGPGMVDPDAAALLTVETARELAALPVAFDGDGRLVVAIADPSGSVALTRVSGITGMDVRPALAVSAELNAAIEHLADGAGTAAAAPGPANQGDGDEPDSALLSYEQAPAVDLDDALRALVEAGGSDLHLTTGLPPMMRVNGGLEPLGDYPELSPRDLQRMIYAILTQKQREQFENELELDCSHAIVGLARFRVNVFQQRDSIGAVLRTIPFEIMSLDDLGMPPQVKKFAYLPRGFVLVTGPTGSGKSTTLASLLDVVNTERSAHIMTVEDPIEFLHKHKTSVVNQRELGTDTHSFAAALKHVLRQDPDVILVGELRDLETIQVALTAAETGHLVFGTLHTQDAPQSVDRIIDVFPPHQQEQIRVMLAGALQGVVCQQLLKTVDGTGRVAATEVMVATPAIKNLVREGKTHQMYSSIQAGKQFGMVTMDQSLAELVRKHKVTYDAALQKCANVADFNRLCGKA